MKSSLFEPNSKLSLLLFIITVIVITIIIIILYNNIILVRIWSILKATSKTWIPTLKNLDPE